MYEYKLLSANWFQVGTIWPMDLVFMSTFDNQSMNIGCVGKLGHLFGFLRHYLLNTLLYNFTTGNHIEIVRFRYNPCEAMTSRCEDIGQKRLRKNSEQTVV